MQHTKIERIRRALVGDPVDRPPISFWAHNFARENTAEDLAAETVRVFRSYDWDFIKIQSRASCFAETWGNQYDYSDHPPTPPTQRHWAIHTAADLQAIRPADPLSGSLGEQIEALRLIRQEVGPDVPILQTVFAPAMVLASMTDGPAGFLDYMRDQPEAIHAALAAIRDTLTKLCPGVSAKRRRRHLLGYQGCLRRPDVTSRIRSIWSAL
ncbi:MAG: uroporphyrinogen decarboxylase family protein [Pseudomonadota bacterium]